MRGAGPMLRPTKGGWSSADAPAVCAHVRGCARGILYSLHRQLTADRTTVKFGVVNNRDINTPTQTCSQVLGPAGCEGGAAGGGKSVRTATKNTQANSVCIILRALPV